MQDDNMTASGDAENPFTKVKLESPHPLVSSKPRTFLEWLITADGVDPEFKKKVTQARIEIDSLPKLQKFARERWPQDYPRDWRKPTPAGAKYGRETMSLLWAQYLNAVE